MLDLLHCECFLIHNIFQINLHDLKCFRLVPVYKRSFAFFMWLLSFLSASAFVTPEYVPYGMLRYRQSTYFISSSFSRKGPYRVFSRTLSTCSSIPFSVLLCTRVALYSHPSDLLSLSFVWFVHCRSTHIQYPCRTGHIAILCTQYL